MRSKRIHHCAVAAGFVLTALATAPAFADGRASVALSPYVIVPSGESVSDAVGQVAVGYDLGPRAQTPIPVRVRIDASYYFGEATDGVFSIGLSARSTTPLYIGAGVTLDTGTLIGEESGPALLPLGGNTAYTPPRNIGAGVTVFIGQKLVSKPGFGLDLEATYHYFPALGGETSNAFGVGIRSSFGK